VLTTHDLIANDGFAKAQFQAMQHELRIARHTSLRLLSKCANSRFRSPPPLTPSPRQ